MYYYSYLTPVISAPVYEILCQMTTPTVTDPLLLAAGVASFDMLSGIRVIQRWSFSDSVDPSNFIDLFKIVLSNVHRQNEQFYSDFSFSTVEIPTLNWFLVSSIFVLTNAKRQPVYYAVGLVFNLSGMPSAPEFTDIAISWSRILTIVAKGLLTNNLALTSLKNVVELIGEDIAVVAGASIECLPTFEISPSDEILYARLLTAHFQTQMTIVIEASSNKPEHAQQIARFLAHFATPQQRRFSSLELLRRASPHLFIQCIESQGQGPPHDLMLMFDRPVTWVQLPDRRDVHVKIYRAEVTTDELRAFHEEFINTKFVQKEIADEGGLNKRLGELRESLRVQDLTIPAPWCVVRVALLLETAGCARFLFCAEQLAAILRTAIALVAIVQTRSAETIAVGDGLEKELKTALRLVGGVDWEIAVALARMYDKDITAKLNGGKRALIRAFSSILGPRKT
jgi:hypothetical protein